MRSLHVLRLAYKSSLRRKAGADPSHGIPAVTDGDQAAETA